MKNDPWLFDAVQWGFWFLAMGFVMRWLAKSRMRSVTDGDIVFLQHPVSTLVVGLVCGGGFAAIAVLSVLFPGKDGSPLISLIFVGFALLGGAIIVEYVRVRHRLEPDGFRYHTFLGKRGLLAWPDIVRVGYSPSMKWFHLSGTRGEVVRVSAMLTGLPEFARAVLKHVATDKIDGTTRDLLEKTSNGNPPSIWANS